MKSDPLPECPFPSHDRTVIRDHLATREVLDSMEATLAQRSFGQRVFRSVRLRNDIAKTRSRIAAEQDYHGDLLSDENLDTYEAWIEAFVEAIETKS